jgi:hypothetical protein
VIARTARAGALLAAVAALALAGCGGGGASTTTTAGGPTRAHYLAQANAICAAARLQTAPLIARVKRSLSVAALLTGGASLVRTLGRIVSQLQADAAAGLAKLRALPQPAADHAAIEAFLEPLGKLIGYIRQAAALLLKAEPLNAYAVLQPATPTSSQVKSAARTFGADQCGAVLSAL